MAYEFYVSIEGTKTGKFKGESLRTPHKDKMPGFFYQSGIDSPRDMASGQASGKRQHIPVVFRKKVGAATPQLANALVTNEVLKTVLFEFVQTTKDGKEEIVFTIKLLDSTVSGHRIVLPDVTSGSTVNQDLFEEVQLTFGKIEWEHKVAKTMAIDDWYKG